ncbi:5'-nucleotidase domain-containing protein 3 [Saguinus oedipus]|uniref:5'-nucleotidase domain-containing protein 3 n=1 Tax=Saguinus oedipus TaxID=9490 RepID=A0ABQ9V1X7_SAGOE|nr:5'-nucleotidase domain-containing protein 3 [Saguinus oedipus]
MKEKREPFRKMNEKGVLLWDKIHKLQKGQIYKQDLTLKHGWRTGAIIPELRSELRIMNTEQYIQTVAWLQTLTGLLEQMQDKGTDACSLGEYTCNLWPVAHACPLALEMGRELPCQPQLALRVGVAEQ